MEPESMMLLGTGLSALGSLPQWFTGNTQENRAGELESTLGSRPKMSLAKGYQDALESAKEQANLTRLPGQDAIEGRLDQTTASQVTMLERMGLGGSTMINGASRAYGNQQEKENELGVSAAKMKLDNQKLLREQENIVGNQENEIWKTNELDPYLQKSNAIMALKEGGLRNKNSALMNLFGSLGNGLMGMGMMGGKGGNWWDKLSGPDSSFKTSVGGADGEESGLFDLLGYGNKTIGA